MGKKYDHGPNMAAKQTYQTSFATGDLDKLISVLVSRVSSKFELFDLKLLLITQGWHLQLHQ